MWTWTYILLSIGKYFLQVFFLSFPFNIILVASTVYLQCVSQWSCYFHLRHTQTYTLFPIARMHIRICNVTHRWVPVAVRCICDQSFTIDNAYVWRAVHVCIVICRLIGSCRIENGTYSNNNDNRNNNNNGALSRANICRHSSFTFRVKWSIKIKIGIPVLWLVPFFTAPPNDDYVNVRGVQTRLNEEKENGERKRGIDGKTDRHRGRKHEYQQVHIGKWDL